MRITQETMVSSSLERLRARMAQLNDAQARLSSGKQVRIPSDDAAVMSSILSLRSAQRARVQETRNASDGATWVSLTDGKLQDGVQALQRVRDLAVRAASSMEPQERAGIATEILSIRDEMVGIANSQNQGQGLFSGTASGSAVALVAGVWTYTGDATQVQRRIGEGEVVTVTGRGDEVFGFADGDDVFTMLETLASQVSAGQATAVSDSIADVDTALGRILDGLAEVGATGNRIESTLAANQDQQIALRGQLSEIEDVDLASATMELQLQEVAYQATLAAMGRALQPSLADFLR